ncbi:hypothetical protein H8M03_06880 [Sphingomonas sabuli]|uniref:Glycosyltransferase RgtA/B/C/D-like domain-containing protein n=1 Tax=Sphingomonas sabuli TaxID=2764186 RepID=A0A7G9KZJ1_9SPHN|nr:hypothetical protein [Sphingomonas sabuli]QNM81790.1 hypothetical protein H8M03_06880 [Sphingomonas sabuli]
MIKGAIAGRVDAGADRPHGWWESPWLLAAAVFLSAVPLLYPPIPPLVDLLGHMGRYRVQLDLGQSAWLRQYYDFHWALIGNLGVDLLIVPLAPLLGLENAVKLVVVAIPPMTVAGFLWVAREVHGRIPPTAYFALPFALGHPFLFGFVNYALSIALAFLAFGLWLRLGRLGKTRLRSWLFVPISLVVFFAHTYGWGVLGLLCFSAEAVRQHDRGVGWVRSAWNAAWHSAVMALPLIIMLAWRSETHGGGTADWFNFKAKFQWLTMALRDRWQTYDTVSMAAIVLVLAESLRNRRLTFSRNLAFSGLVLAVGFVLLPRIIFGSAYADMRLAPYMVAVLVLAVRFRGAISQRLGTALAVLGIAFLVIRVASTTASMAIASDDQQAKLKALDHIPMGARVISQVGMPCTGLWDLPRNSHLGAMVVVRRDGYSNDQWTVEGANLLKLQYEKAGRFAADPSQIVRPNACPDRLRMGIDRSLATLPREDFDYLWLIDAPAHDPKLVDGLKPVWRGKGSILYRLDGGSANP